MSDFPADQTGEIEPSQVSNRKRSPKKSFGSILLSHILVIFFCVGFPAMVTGIAPVSWIKFERQDRQVSATAKICLLFVVPYRTLTVSPVIGVGDRFVEGTFTHEVRDSRTIRTRSEDEDYLVIQGNEEAAEVPVSPFSIQTVVKKSKAFLKDEQMTELNLFAVANWKFSVIAGGLVSLLTVLYAFALIYETTLRFIRIFKWALGIPTDHRSFSTTELNGTTEAK